MRSAFIYSVFIVITGILAYLGWIADSKSFVGSLFAASLATFIVFFIEMELRPHISIEIAGEGRVKPKPDERKFLWVAVTNRPLWWPLKHIMDRRPAYQVRAWITFLTTSNDPIFSPGRQMIGRWSNTPEPVRPMTIIQRPNGASQITYIPDPSVIRDAVDIASGSSERLDIVMRKPKEKGCLGWHNRIIQNPNLRPEDMFKLKEGRYHVNVRVDVSGRSFNARFRIVCDTGIEDFRLEKI